MTLSPKKVLYTGPGVSGCLTSLSVIGKVAVPAFAPRRAMTQSENEWHIEWRMGNQLVPLILSLSGARMMYRFRSLSEAIKQLSGPQVQRMQGEIDFLKTVDGLVFVADSQGAVGERNVEFLRRTIDDLLELGRDPSSIPLVFQLNKRDLPEVDSVARMRERLKWPGSHAYVETVAINGSGISEALDTLIKLE